MPITNDYNEAIPVERNLFAVQTSDGGWTIADGPGTQILPPKRVASAGFHLPVRFNTRNEAIAAITSGPSEWFDIQPGSTWVTHCLASGGTYCEAYEKTRGPRDRSYHSG